MGFSGELVFGRSERPLLEAPVFGGAQEDDDGGITAWWPRPGGWQTLQFHQKTSLAKPEEVLRAVVEWTGAPACVASVHDSSVALVWGLEPGGDQWDAWLNLAIAAEMSDRPLSEMDACVPGDASRALAWARSVGVGPGLDVATIEEVLRSHETFAEELFDTLLDRLGFPAASDPEAEG
ncbi:hypothetical protein ABZ454_35440 [Streptomyces sp. NPDC005803]|uniref:hypothetical protein n=1 Tax=Streptomyces sp. NPDC005803 TaxID=3154297 RepID=UPI0033E1C4B0